LRAVAIGGRGKFFPQHLSVMCGRKGGRYGSRRFLRGINVGGHRTFRPSILARGLSDYDVVNVGAAGTFIVRKPGLNRAKFRAEVLRKLPFEAEVVLCDGRDLIGLEMENPFGTEPSRPDIVRFVSILSRPGRTPADIPCKLPPRGSCELSRQKSDTSSECTVAT
jgi:hypothetical protein